MIRGHGVEYAADLLSFTPKRVARTINKTLRSAVSNAMKAESKLDVHDLVVKTAIVGDGPTMKRFRPRAQGRVYPILKRTSHITIVVATHDAIPVTKRRRPVATTAATAPAAKASAAKAGGRKAGAAKAGAAKAGAAKARGAGTGAGKAGAARKKKAATTAAAKATAAES
jgi:large subunit ribosomal protein L22